MQIILLSGGSGKRLWPLSNDARSKQFLRLLTSPNGSCESMLQRVVRQIGESALDASVTIATAITQQDAIINQLGKQVNIVTEPCRRDTFPAICLSCAYLEKEKKCSRNEVVVVMPCDQYTEEKYFDTVLQMAEHVKTNCADLVLMGIKPTYPSSKYGYIVPNKNINSENSILEVERFTEKPNNADAQKLIEAGALWNGGVFAFRLGYITDLLKRYIDADAFEQIRSRYEEFPKISFDYEVAEKTNSVAVVPYCGKWKDLGTWNALSEELENTSWGNVIMDDQSVNTHVVNELDIPLVCLSAKDLVIVASYDGILVSDKSQSENIKTFADRLHNRPMYEQRIWGEYKVIGSAEFEDGYKTLTKQLTIKSGKNISYQLHRHRDEVWTFVNGNGLLVLDGKIQPVMQGDTVHIGKGIKHTVKAINDLTFIEVQFGDELIEEDIERFNWGW